jgi:hypothetical protein
MSLRSFRGKVVIPAFSDSQCTTICPLKTTAHASDDAAVEFVQDFVAAME